MQMQATLHCRRPVPGAWALVAALAWLVAPPLPATAQTAEKPLCDEVGHTRGDYVSDRKWLKLVEDFHFTPNIEALTVKGDPTNIGSNLDYTIRSFPNHHRALSTLVRFGERTKSDRPPGLPRTIECYFQRAVKFRPDDTIVRMLFANYLIAKSRPQEAQAQLEAAQAHVAEDNPFGLYNLGLLYADLKLYDKSLELAHRALKLGLKRTELRDRLVKAGQWREPDADPADAAAAGPAPAAAAASSPS
jgi:tetratricopeptide (TPR) repeat protein